MMIMFENVVAGVVCVRSVCARWAEQRESLEGPTNRPPPPVGEGRAHRAHRCRRCARQLSTAAVHPLGRRVTIGDYWEEVG